MKYLKAFALFMLHGIIGLLLMGFFLLMVMEWAAGCGETYTDAKGNKHQNECLFIKR